MPLPALDPDVAPHINGINAELARHRQRIEALEQQTNSHYQEWDNYHRQRQPDQTAVQAPPEPKFLGMTHSTLKTVAVGVVLGGAAVYFISRRRKNEKPVVVKRET